MANNIGNQEFNNRISSVRVTRDQRINLIESRLKDLTGLRLAKKNKYQYLCNENYDETPIKRSGKETIVVFPTDLIENDLRTDDHLKYGLSFLAELELPMYWRKA